MLEVPLDAAGRPRSPATLRGAGRPPRNKGQRYPADPPTVAEIVAVMRQPAPVCTQHGCERSASCFGAPGCASTKPP